MREDPGDMPSWGGRSLDRKESFRKEGRLFMDHTPELPRPPWHLRRPSAIYPILILL